MLLKFLDIDSYIIILYITAAQRREIALKFDCNLFKYKILIILYSLICTKYNFQYLYWYLYCYKVLFNKSITAQAIERNCCINCFSNIIYIYFYYIQRIFDNRQIINNIIKAMPQIFAELNREMFFNKKDSNKNVICDIEQ